MTVGKIENGSERGFVKHCLKSKLSFNNWPIRFTLLLHVKRAAEKLPTEGWEEKRKKKHKVAPKDIKQNLILHKKKKMSINKYLSGPLYDNKLEQCIWTS